MHCRGKLDDGTFLNQVLVALEGACSDAVATWLPLGAGSHIDSHRHRMRFGNWQYAHALEGCSKHWKEDYANQVPSWYQVRVLLIH